MEVEIFKKMNISFYEIVFGEMDERNMKLILRLFFGIGFLLSFYSLSAQTRTFAVTDQHSDVPLYQAYIWNLSTESGEVTDEQGRAYLTARPGDSVRISYVGYQDTIILISEAEIVYRIPLHIKPLREVVILAEEDFHRQAAEGRQQVSLDFLTAIPSLTGDADIMKTLTFLPGVTGGQEGYSHLLVRGGGQDQNLILMDGASLFNVNHFGGFISMFHSDMIRSVDFYKSYWPSRFGGRLSSVLDLRTTHGDYQNHHQTFDFGIIYSKAQLEGPLWKNKVSYSLGARRTFIDLITGPLIRNTRKGKRIGEMPNYIIGDANARVDFRLADDQHLSLSYFYGSDKMEVFSNENESHNNERYTIENSALALNYSWDRNPYTGWRMHASTSSYAHAFTDNIRDRYGPGGSTFFEEEIFRRKSGNTIRSYKLNAHGFYRPESEKSKWKFQYGAEFEMLDYSLYLDRAEQFHSMGHFSTVDSLSESAERKNAITLAAYGDAEYRLSPQWTLKGGVRLPRYSYGTYHRFLMEPKVMLSHDLDERSTFNVTFNVQQQNITLLGFTDLQGFFREFYTTAEEEVPPGRSLQWSAGYFTSPERRWVDHFSVELFYKKQNGLVRFIPSADEDRAVVHYKDYLKQNGKNVSYGAEFLIQKTAGQLHASLSYTWANSDLKFPDLNRGQAFPSDYDFRHNVKILLMYMWGKGYRVAAGWNYSTGRPFTLPNSVSPRTDFSGRYFIASDINNYRMPAFHRLDLNLDREYLTKRGRKNWFGISVYNAYNRINPFYVTPEADGKLKVYGFFPVIPSFHFGFEI